MDNSVPQTPQQPQPVSPAMPVQNVQQVSPSKKKYIVIAAIVAALILVAGLVFALTRMNNTTTTEKVYTLSVDGEQVPSEDIAEILTYYRNSEGEKFNESSALSHIQDLYVVRSVLRKEYTDRGLSQSQLVQDSVKYQNVQGMESAPLVLKELNGEIAAMRQVLVADVGVQVRSGHMMLGRIVEPVSASEQAQLQNLIRQRIVIYRSQMSSESAEQVLTAFRNDSVLKGQPKILAVASTFDEMAISHPFMNDEQFISAVFETPVNTASPVFQTGENDTIGFGVIYPTNPIPEGEFRDFREWLQMKMKNVKVENNFT